MRKAANHKFKFSDDGRYRTCEICGLRQCSKAVWEWENMNSPHDDRNYKNCGLTQEVSDG